MRNEEKRTNQLRTGACLPFFFNVFFFLLRLSWTDDLAATNQWLTEKRSSTPNNTT